MPPTSHNDPHVWTNLNPLLAHYAGATGIKTGWTAAAGNCLLFAATRGGKELIGVVLDSSKPDSAAGMNAAASDARGHAELGIQSVTAGAERCLVRIFAVRSWHRGSMQPSQCTTQYGHETPRGTHGKPRDSAATRSFKTCGQTIPTSPRALSNGGP